MSRTRMQEPRRHLVSAALLAVVSIAAPATAADLEIDGNLPDGGDCAMVGVWSGATATCRVDALEVAASDRLFVRDATLEVGDSLVVLGQLTNHARVVVRGHLDVRNSYTNFWDGTTTVHGRFDLFFMYNFGGMTVLPGAEIVVDHFIENNAPLVNHGAVELNGLLTNVPPNALENHGTFAIGATGEISSDARVVNLGQLDNGGLITNRDVWIDHCDGAFGGNPVEGDPPIEALSLTLAPDEEVRWCGLASATGYDVIVGDLGALRTGLGDFAGSTLGCLADDVAATSVVDSALPLPGEGRWYLVRPVGATGASGTGANPGPGYDVGYGASVAPRGPGIAASPDACP